MDNNFKKDDKKGGNRQPLILFILFTLIAVFITSMIYSSASRTASEEIRYSTFLDLVEDNQVKSVVFADDKVNITLIADTTFTGEKSLDQASEKAQEKRAQECLDRVNLTDAQLKYPAELSGGMQKRAAIARAISMQPSFSSATTRPTTATSLARR